MSTFKISSTNHFTIGRLSTLISYNSVVNKQVFYKSWHLAATELRESFSDRQTDRRVKMWWFSDVSGAELRPHLAGGLVEPQLMTDYPVRVGDPAFGRGAGWNVTLWLVGGVKGSLRLVMAQGRTAGHQLCFYQGTSNVGTGFRDRNFGKTSYLGAAVCWRTFHWGLSCFTFVWFVCFLSHAP